MDSSWQFRVRYYGILSINCCWSSDRSQQNTDSPQSKTNFWDAFGRCTASWNNSSFTGIHCGPKLVEKVVPTFLASHFLGLRGENRRVSMIFIDCFFFHIISSQGPWLMIVIPQIPWICRDFHGQLLWQLVIFVCRENSPWYPVVRREQNPWIFHMMSPRSGVSMSGQTPKHWLLQIWKGLYHQFLVEKSIGVVYYDAY